MSNKKTNYLFMVLLVIIFAAPLFAQMRETGIILGTVMNNEEPMPGVTVTVSSPKLIGGPATTYTDKDGHYRFPALAPGIYEATASLEGFSTVTRRDIRLFVGNSITVDFDLQAQAREESLEISGETPLIDATTPAMSKTVPIETVEKLPKFSFALDLFTLTPGVGDLDYIAYGAGGAQANAYWFDGVDISNPVGGSYWVFPNYNWIEEVQVVGLGAPAEYGGYTGVVTNSISRSGSNDFHGLFETFFQNTSLTYDNVDPALFPSFTPAEKDLFTDTTGQIGGRIIRDKLWFFSGFQYYYVRDVPFGYPPEGSSDPNSKQTDEQPRIINKLTYKANQNNTLQGFIEWDDYDITNDFADAVTFPEATYITKAPQWFWNLGWTSVVKPETLLDIRTSGFQTNYGYRPKDPTTPGHYDSGTGEYSVNGYAVYDTNRYRTQVNASVSHYARDFVGNHDFKFGVEHERSRAERLYYYQGGLLYGDYYGAPYYRYLWDGYDTDTKINRTSAYVQDSWNVTDKLTLSLGVRWDHNRARLQGSDIGYDTDPVAPRVGFTYDLAGDEKTVIKAHYGHYHEGLVTFFIDGIDDFGDKITEIFNTETGQWDFYSITPGVSRWRIASDLKQPYTRQFTAGLDKQLPGEVALGAHYIYRRDIDLIEDIDVEGVYVPIPFVNPLTGETITVFNKLNPENRSLLIDNFDELFRRYDGFEIYGNKRFSRDFSVFASLVISRAKGNVNNTTSAADGFSTVFDSPNERINIVGRLTNDPTYEIKVNGYYSFPWGINTSWYFRHFTGDTWTPEFRVPGSVLDQGLTDIFIEPRGSRRLPSRNIFDLRLEKAFPIYRGDLKFTADFFNLFNTGYPIEVAERFGPASFGEPLDFTDPREIRLGVRYQF